MVHLSKTDGSALCLVLTLILALAGGIPLPVRTQEKMRVRPTIVGR